MKKVFRYELHCHTSEGSGCSQMPAKAAVDFYLEQGYDGIVVSDHFTGKTTVPKDYAWEDRIHYFYENGFSIAKRYGDERGLKVFFAPEWSSAGNDFLLMGLDKDWWLKQTDFFTLTPNQVFDRVHEGGGFVVHAHPFAEAPWIPCIRLFPRKEDAVEIYNGGMSEFGNRMAYEYAKAYGLPMTGGSDTHSVEHKNLCGIETERECFCIEDIIDVIRKREAKPFCRTQNFFA